MARRDFLLRILGDADDAKRELKETADELRDFGQQKAEARAEIKTEAARIQLQRLNERLNRLGQQEATPKVRLQMGRTVEQIERLEQKLEKLDGKNVAVDIDVDRAHLGRSASVAAGVFGGALKGAIRGALAIPAAASAGLFRLLGIAGGGLGGGGPAGGFSGIGGAVGARAAGGPAMLAQVAASGAQAVAGLVTSSLMLTQVIIPLVGAVGALAASFVSAAIGAGALATAFVAALGPVVVVAVAFFARLAKIIAAVKDEQDNAADKADRVAAAQEQVTAATENLADAQANLRQQTVTAWDAYRDAIERVKDGLLEVEGAEIGVDRARLNTRNAQAALADFRKELGATGTGAESLFKKFTDVDVQFDRGALDSLITKLPGRTSDADERRLEGLILDVREAKLQERVATDRLGDSQRQLARDRRTEGRFLRDGIRAYDGYDAAVRRVRDANRQLRTATNQANTARRRQSELWSELSPAERRFGRLLIEMGDAVKAAFTPAVNRVIRGVTSALRAFIELLRDRSIRRRFEDIGEAIGGVFRTIAQELRRPAFRRVFRELMDGGVELVRVLGSRVFRDFLRIMLRIASAALPEALRLVRDFARGFSNLERDSRSEGFDKRVRRFVKSFRDWIGLIKEVSLLFLDFMGAGRDAGDNLVVRLTRVVRRMREWMGDPENRAKMLAFFRRSVERTEEIAHALFRAAHWASRLFYWMDKIAKIPGEAVDKAKKGGGVAIPPLKIPRIGFSAFDGTLGGADLSRLAPVAFGAAGTGGGGGVAIDKLVVQAPAGRNVDARALGPLIDREFRARGWG